MLVYRYDEDTKEYLGSEEAFLDPLETERKGREIYLLPANCTFDAPPDDREGFYLKRVGETWEYTVIPTPEEDPKEQEITEARRLSMVEGFIQDYMDDTVATKGYDDINSACTYAVSNDPTFKAEGAACVEWRDAIWKAWFPIRADIEAGKREIPTPEELVEKLPKLSW